MESSQGITPKEEGLNLLKAGKITDAIQVFQQGIATEPDNAQLHMYLGIAYNEQNNRLLAIRHLEESLNLQESYKGYYNLGLVYENSNRLDEAIRQYKMALEMAPNYTNAQNALNRLQKQYAAAHPELAEEPPQEDPNNPAVPWEAAQQGGTAIASVPKNVPPDWHAIQAKKEQEVQEARRNMIRSGLTYGVICGSIFILLLSFCAAMFTAFPLVLIAKIGILKYILIMLGIGAVFGGIVGLWIGYTCGGEGAGMQAGAAIGLLLGLILGICSGTGIMTLLTMILMAGLCGIIGMFIGRMVDASIGQI